jgi:cytochrome c-type biogenesis protein CcmH/NrfG
LFVTLARLDPEAGLARARERAARMDRAEGASLLGDVFAAMGRTEEARAAYDQAVRLDPANVRWRAARSALR